MRWTLFVPRQVRCEAYLTDFFYNETRPAFAETRIISQHLDLSFVGSEPFTFRPGMVFEGHVSMLYNDQVALPEELITTGVLTLTATALLRDGSNVALPTIYIDPQGIVQWKELEEKEAVVSYCQNL